MTKKQDAMADQPSGPRYVGFNERWNENHPKPVEKPQEEQLFDPDEDEGVEVG